ncbi:hypothetical protein ATKI12_7581 [Kitasatospora sp. Ki12]
MSGRDGRDTDGRPPGAAAAGRPALPAHGGTAGGEHGGTVRGERGGTPVPALGHAASGRHDGPGVRR